LIKKQAIPEKGLSVTGEGYFLRENNLVYMSEGFSLPDIDLTTVTAVAALLTAITGGYVLWRGKQYPYNSKKRKKPGWIDHD
jgi:hypothetical protein